MLVVDAQRLMADALTVALSAAPGFVALPWCPRSTAEAVEAATHLRPDVVVLDYWMTGPGDGPTTTRAILDATPGTAVLLSSWVHGPDHVEAALAAGAAGFVPKSVSLELLQEAIVRAAAGERPVFADRLRRLVASIHQRAEEAERSWSTMMSLSQREVEVVRAMATGRSLPQLAPELYVSTGTLRNHVQHILKKTGAHNQREVVQMARSLGLVAGAPAEGEPGDVRVPPSPSIRPGSRQGPISILVADEQRLFTEALGAALGHYPDLEVAAAPAGDGHAAVAAAIASRPDVVLYDYWMPATAGPAAARYLASWSPGTTVLLSSWLHGPTEVEQARVSGAAGLLSKRLTIDQLVEAVRAVPAGEPLPHAERDRRVRAPAPSPNSVERRWSRLVSLTPREIEVLRLLAQGKAIKEVAKELCIAVGTARNHAQSILDKTGASGTVEAVGIAYDEGLVRGVGRPGTG